jgi:hypothetical protein
LSDPNELKAYKPEFSEPVHMDMKRWSEERGVAAPKKGNSTSNLPLFEKYQFFTPGEYRLLVFSWQSTDSEIGIFMSLIVLAIVLSILGVGLKAISSLEVSYGAFDKEMGPAAQKKQM